MGDLMLSNKLFLTLLLSSVQSISYAQSNNEKIILSLSSPESIQCNTKIYDRHIFKLTATQTILEDGSLDNSKTKIYEDGVLKGICKETIKTIAFTDYERVLTNLAIIKELSDDEVIRLFNSTVVGYCHLRYGSELVTLKANNHASLSREAFNTMLEEKGVELETSDRRTILAATLRDLVAEKKCGSFSKEIVRQTKESNLKHLAKANVGFDYLVSVKTTKEEFLKAHFNAKLLQKEFNLTVSELKKNQYTVEELLQANFSTLELFKGGYPLAELMNNNDSSNLRSIVSIQEFIKAGANISTLKNLGFNEVNEIKPHFTIKDFNTLYLDNWNSSKAPTELKRLGYSAKEIKDAGHGLAELKSAGFNEVRDLKTLFTIKEFNTFYMDNWNSSKAPQELKRLGFSVKEIKELGHGISELKSVGFDEIKDIKPLYTIKDFNKFYSDNWDSSKAPKELKRLGYKVSEIKEVGHGITELKSAGFDEIKDIKPLFTIKDFNTLYSDNWDSSKAPRELKRLGYPIGDIKKLGHGIMSLKAAGFNEAEDIKPLFDIKEFNNLYSDNWDNSKAPKELKRLGFTIKEIKELGHSISALKGAGFNEVKEIKPLFSIKDFNNLYSDNWDSSKAPLELKRLGYTLEEVKQLGYSEQILKSLGY